MKEMEDGMFFGSQDPKARYPKYLVCSALFSVRTDQRVLAEAIDDDDLATQVARLVKNGTRAELIRIFEIRKDVSAEVTVDVRLCLPEWTTPDITSQGRA